LHIKIDWSNSVDLFFIKNDYVLNTPDYLFTAYDFTAFETQTLNSRQAWGFSTNSFNILHQNDNSIILSQVFHYNSIDAENGISGLTKGYAHMKLTNVCTMNPIDFISFDVLIDYNFAAVRTLDVNEYINLPGAIDPMLLTTVMDLWNTPQHSKNLLILTRFTRL